MFLEYFMTEYGIKANEQQMKAMLKTDGPVLLLAVPGSGKTTVIVGRVGYMVKCCGIEPENILTLTFTIAAAREMKERYLSKFGTERGQAVPHFSTIHSFCLKTIKLCEKKYGLSLPQLMPDNTKLIRSILYDMDGMYPQDSTVRSAAQVVTYAKNMMLKDNEILNIDVTDFDPLHFYKRYMSEMKDSGRMDFDDQLILAYKYLEEYPEILEMAQNQYKYINVDEAQDTSLIQHKIIRLLASKNRNLFMVGDEDQCIYKFRGAYPNALLEFGKIYPDAEILYMETNYRSTGTIINAAKRFIRQNKDRHNKEMTTPNPAGGELIRTNIQDFSGQHMHLLEKLLEGQGSAAVLYRNNESAIPLLNVLDKNEVAFRYRDESGLFFTHFIVTDVMAYFRLSMDPSDLEAFSKLYYKFGAYLSKHDIEWVKSELGRKPGRDIFEILCGSAALDVKQRDRLRNVGYILKMVRDKTPLESIRLISMSAGYSEWMGKMIAEGNSENTLQQKIDTLMAIGMEEKTNADFMKRIEELANYKCPKYEEKPFLTLSTIHSSKGLEFDKVYIIDAFDGLLPSDAAFKALKSGDRKEYEEEVRLFYVAATRARNELEFITPTKKFGRKLDMSVFLAQFLDGNMMATALKPQGPNKPGIRWPGLF